MMVREKLKRVPPLVAAVHRGRAVQASARRFAEDARFAAGRMQRRRRIADYLATHDERKLQLGTGSNPMPGWLNTDVVDYRRRNEVVYLDAREPFPLPDRSFDIVFSEHTIEHLTYAEGRRCLAECRRVLRPGGTIRIATPSLTRLTALYKSDLDELQQRYLRWSIDTFAHEADRYLPGFALNNMFYNFAHRFVYDEQTLEHALTGAGFVDVKAHAVGESDDERLQGLERHLRSVAEFNAYETLVLEARTPPVGQR
jgi:predicted SAM-dependent methyltransferase